MTDLSADLETLMTRYQNADAEATTALVAAVSPLLYRFLASQMGHRAEAEDLLQDVWLKIHSARHTYRPGEPVLPWFYAIARHVRVDHYRKRLRLSRHELAMSNPPEPSVRSPSARSSPDFAEIVARLPEAQREVVTLLKVNELSLEEVARITSSTVGAVKQRAHRAYRHLRDSLTQNLRRSE